MMNIPSQAIVPLLDNNKSSISGWPLMPSLTLGYVELGWGVPPAAPCGGDSPCGHGDDEWEPSAP